MHRCFPHLLESGWLERSVPPENWFPHGLSSPSGVGATRCRSCPVGDKRYLDSDIALSTIDKLLQHLSLGGGAIALLEFAHFLQRAWNESDCYSRQPPVHRPLIPMYRLRYRTLTVDRYRYDFGHPPRFSVEKRETARP